MNKLKLITLFLALSFLGAGCSTQSDTIDFTNSPDSTTQIDFRSLAEAKEEGRVVNEVFFYSLDVPEGVDEPLSFDHLKDETESNSLRFVDTVTRENANIEVQDPESVTLDHLKAELTLPLVDFVNRIWSVNTEDNRLNSDTKEVSSIEKIEFAGKTAYTFTATETFKTTRGERHFDGKSIFLFVEHKGLNYIFSYPEENETLKSLVHSLEFHQ